MQNEMRDRLVELVQDALFQHAHYVGKERRRALEAETEAEHSEIYESIKTLHEYVADYLIENGVIVPPCKVGDTVYQTDGVRVYESSIRNIIYETEVIAFDERAIHKSIFLTKEEAEQKLRKEDEGNERKTKRYER